MLCRDKLQPQSKPTLRDLQSMSNASPVASSSPILAFSSEPANLQNSQQSNEASALSIGPASTPQDEISLANITVPLESIKPSKKHTSLLKFPAVDYGFFPPSLTYPLSLLLSSLTGSMLPVTIFDEHSLRVLLHFARECPPSRPDVLVVIISMLSSAPMPVTNIRFQAAVPKVQYLSVMLIYLKL